MCPHLARPIYFNMPIYYFPDKNGERHGSAPSLYSNQKQNCCEMVEYNKDLL